MTDPVRWRDDESASPEIRELLASGTPPPALDAGTRVAIASFAATLATAEAAAAAGATTLWGTKLVVGIVSLLSIGAIGGAVMISTQSSERPSPVASEHTRERGEAAASPAELAPLADPASVIEAPLADEPAVADAPALAPTDVRRVARPVPRTTAPLEAPPPSAEDALQVEAALLERARGALSTDPRMALELADQHGAEHAAGQLAAERELIAIDALVRLDRRPEARRRAHALIERAPRGMYARRVERMLEPERVDER